PCPFGLRCRHWRIAGATVLRMPCDKACRAALAGSFDIAQTFPERQVREDHGQKVLEAREALDLMLAVVRATQSRKVVSGRWAVNCTSTNFPTFMAASARK